MSPRMGNKADFVQQIYQAGLDAGLTDAAARVRASQAALESDYGDNAVGYNYFGITAGPNWTGDTVQRGDKDSAGNPISQQFRSYPSRDAGLLDAFSMMDDAFPAFNSAPDMPSALAALRTGVRGTYYGGSQKAYETTVQNINAKYLPASSAAAPAAANQPAAFDTAAFLNARGTTKKGYVGVNSSGLDSEFSLRMSALITAAETATGSTVTVNEGYRPPERQAQYYSNYLYSIALSKGFDDATARAKAQVSYGGQTYKPLWAGGVAAKPGQSKHQSGMAMDIDAGPARTWMAQHAGDFGIEWGGGWGNGQSDPPHFQIPQTEVAAFHAGTPLQSIGLAALDATNAGIGLPPLNVPQVASELDVTAPVRPAPAPGFYRGEAPARDAYSDQRREGSSRAPNAAPALQALDIIRSSATYGIRREAGAPAMKFPTSEVFEPDGKYDGYYHIDVGGFGALTDPRTQSLLGNSPGGVDDVGAGPMSWFSSTGDMADGFGSTRVGHTGNLVGPIVAPAGAPPAAVLPADRSISIGMVEAGNIDLNNRPVYFGDDGTYGTERSFSIGTDKGEVLIPQIVNGKLVSQAEAIAHYQQTGENLGTFTDAGAADAYATQLHQRNQGLGTIPVPMPGRPSGIDAAPTPAPVAAPAPAAPAPRTDPKTGYPIVQKDGKWVIDTSKLTKEQKHALLMGQQSDPRLDPGDTVVGGIVQKIAKEKVQAAAPVVAAATSAVVAGAGDLGAAAKAKADELVSGAFGSLVSGAAGLGRFRLTSTDRVSTIIHQARGGDSTLPDRTPADVNFGERATIPFQTARVAPTSYALPRITSAQYSPAMMFDQHFTVPAAVAQTPIAAPTVAETRSEQRQAAAPKVSTQTVKPQKVEPAPVQPAPHGPVGTEVKVARSSSPTRSVTKLNPDYAAWEKRQNVSPAISGHLSGGDARESHAPSNIQVGEPAPPKFITTRAPLETHAANAVPGRYTVRPGDTIESIARRSGANVQELRAANGNGLRPGQTVTLGSPGGIPLSPTSGRSITAQTAATGAANQNRAPMVQIASGKSVPVGTIGTAQGGTLVYQVQANGSVKELNSGRTTSTAPSTAPGTFNRSTGTWN